MASFHPLARSSLHVEGQKSSGWGFPAGWLSALGSRASQPLDMSPSLGGCSIGVRGGLVTSFCWGQECNQARGTLWIFDPRPTWMYEYREGEIRRLAPVLQCNGGLLGAGGEHSEGHDSACAFLLQLSARGNPAAAGAASWRVCRQGRSGWRLFLLARNSRDGADN